MGIPRGRPCRATSSAVARTDFCILWGASPQRANRHSIDRGPRSCCVTVHEHLRPAAQSAKSDGDTRTDNGEVAGSIPASLTKALIGGHFYRPAAWCERSTQAAPNKCLSCYGSLDAGTCPGGQPGVLVSRVSWSAGCPPSGVRTHGSRRSAGRTGPGGSWVTAGSRMRRGPSVQIAGSWLPSGISAGSCRCSEGPCRSHVQNADRAGRTGSAERHVGRLRCLGGGACATLFRCW